MKFFKKLIKLAIGIFLVKKGIEIFEKKMQNSKNPGKTHSITNKILPYIKNYLNKR